jgi:homoserine kinase
LPLVGQHGILGVALSGAGPAVLVIVDREESLAGASNTVQNRMGAELLICRFSRVGAFQTIENI